MLARLTSEYQAASVMRLLVWGLQQRSGFTIWYIVRGSRASTRQAPGSHVVVRLKKDNPAPGPDIILLDRSRWCCEIRHFASSCTVTSQRYGLRAARGEDTEGVRHVPLSRNLPARPRWSIQIGRPATWNRPYSSYRLSGCTLAFDVQLHHEYHTVIGRRGPPRWGRSATVRMYAASRGRRSRIQNRHAIDADELSYSSVLVLSSPSNAARRGPSLVRVPFWTCLPSSVPPRG